jgi:hypothetical protein
MNATVVVALITSLSTPAAGALASFTSLRIQRRQVKHQDNIAVLDRQEREDARLRELRRDAYIGLLTYCDELAAVFNDCWGSKPDDVFSKPPGEPYKGTIGPLDKARRLSNSIETPLNTVYLEGPKSIMGAVDDLRVALHDTFDKLVDLASSNKGVNDSLLHIALRVDGDITAPYIPAKVAFMNAAREALGKPRSTNGSCLSVDGALYGSVSSFPGLT